MLEEKTLLSVLEALVAVEEESLPAGTNFDPEIGKLDISEAVTEMIRRKNGCRKAVLVLLEKLAPSQAVVDVVVRKYLAIFRKNKTRFYWNQDALSVAVSAAELGASRKAGEEVFEEITRQGWYGRAEDFAKKVLGRGLISGEAMLLVKSYTEDLCSRSPDQEKELLRLTRKYMTRTDARRAVALLRKFRKEFSRADY